MRVAVKVKGFIQNTTGIENAVIRNYTIMKNIAARRQPDGKEWWLIMYITPNAKRKIKEAYTNLANTYGMIHEYEELKSPISDKRLEEVVCKIVNHIGLDKDFNFAELVETYNYHS